MVCGRPFITTTNLSWQMISHRHQAGQSEVFQQQTVDEFLAVQLEKTLSSDATNTLTLIQLQFQTQNSHYHHS